MKFSVIIPCYNAAPWLPQMLASLAAQTLPPHQVIVIDDGSTDESQQIISASPLPITLLQTPQVGPALARNAGIAAATGDWVAFLDADDWWLPDHLERIKALVTESKDVVYLAAAQHFSINVNRIVSQSDSPFEQPQTQLDAATYLRLYRQYGLLEMSTMAVKRQRLIEIGGFDPEMRGAEDLELMLRVVLGQTWCYDPIPSSVYRCNNPESHSRKFVSSAALTAKFRAFVRHQAAYDLPQSLLQGIAQTMVSKAIMHCEPEPRRQIMAIAWPYLPAAQRAIFTVADRAPAVYEQLNALKQQFRGQSYSPRKVLP